MFHAFHTTPSDDTLNLRSERGLACRGLTNSSLSNISEENLPETLCLQNVCFNTTVSSSVTGRDFVVSKLKEPTGVLDTATMTASRD